MYVCLDRKLLETWHRLPSCFLLEIKPSVPWIKETTFNFTWIRCSATRGRLRFQSSINISVSRFNAQLHFWYNTQNIIDTSSYWFLLCCRASLTETVDTRKFRKLFVAFQLNLRHDLIIMLKLMRLCSWFINGFIVFLTVKLLKFHLRYCIYLPFINDSYWF